MSCYVAELLGGRKFFVEYDIHEELVGEGNGSGCQWSADIFDDHGQRVEDIPWPVMMGEVVKIHQVENFNDPFIQRMLFHAAKYKKIWAIKIFRTITGFGLKEAKFYIDGMVDAQKMQAQIDHEESVEMPF